MTRDRVALALLCPAWAEGDPILQAAQAVESQLKARVGFAIHDTGSGQAWHYRADERFPMAGGEPDPRLRWRRRCARWH
ncbi:hypothetical protein GCM10025795_53980 [Verticiella sediminum]